MSSNSAAATTTAHSGGGNSAAVTAGAKMLQERLHELITRLSATMELVKNWPESEGDDASIHVETTTKLIASIHSILASIQRVDGVMQTDAALRKNLQECLVPLDLLDLLDYGGGSSKNQPDSVAVGVNPDCFSRALLREALGQLAGLKRRKLALEMLGAAVQAGLNRQIAAMEESSSSKTTTTTTTNNNNKSPDTESSSKKKRKADSVKKEHGEDKDHTSEPPIKKQTVAKKET